MPVTDQDLRALTYLAGRLRVETQGCREWDDAGTYSNFKSALSGQNLLIACQRVLAHATDPEAKTPGAVKRPFNPEPTNAPRPVPFDPQHACHVCQRPEHPPTDHRFISVEAKRAARPAPRPTQLRVVADGLCPHGVPPVNCLEHGPRAPKPKPPTNPKPPAARAEVRRHTTTPDHDTTPTTDVAQAAPKETR